MKGLNSTGCEFRLEPGMRPRAGESSSASLRLPVLDRLLVDCVEYALISSSGGFFSFSADGLRAQFERLDELVGNERFIRLRPAPHTAQAKAVLGRRDMPDLPSQVGRVLWRDHNHSSSPSSLRNWLEKTRVTANRLIANSSREVEDIVQEFLNIAIGRSEQRKV